MRKRVLPRFVVLHCLLSFILPGLAEERVRVAEIERSGDTTHVSIEAPTGDSVALQRSLDLQSWCAVALHKIPASGSLRFADQTEAQSAYYRALSNGANAITGFDVWCLAQQAVRESPDHLVERARLAVRTRRLESIFAFVRDEILVYPVEPYGFGDFRAVSSVRACSRRAS